MSLKTITLSKGEFYDVDKNVGHILRNENVLNRFLRKANEMGLRGEKIRSVRVRRDDLKQEVYLDFNFEVGSWGLPR